MSRTQFIYLFKRELQSTRRTRGVIIMIIVLPVILWGMNVFFLLMRVSNVPGAGISPAVPVTSGEVQSTVEELSPADISIDLGIPVMVAIVLTFLTVNPFVAASIAGEREKRTIELLLSLPVSRREILLGKFAAGTVLGMISLLVNLFCMLVYVHVMNTFIIPASDLAVALGITFDLDMFPAITLTLFLCTLLNLGIGISLASLVKSSETSRQLFTLLILPVFLFIVITFFTGIPEVLSRTMDSPLPLLLYLIPWTHVIAILQKSMLPGYFTTSDFLLIPLGNVLVDVIFHLIAVIISLVVAMWGAAKVFEREGLVS